MADLPDDSFFRNLCLNAGVALIGTDEQLRIRFCNLSASRMLGMSAEGQPITAIVPEDRRALAERLCERTLARGETSEFEFRHHNRAGDPVDLAVTLSPISSSEGRRIGISVYIRDVTRRLELERSMADAQKMSALGVMAGQVAHHFNNVLGGIITSLDFARNSDDSEMLQRAMRRAISSLTRANRLTQGLLAFAEGDRSECTPGSITDIVSQYATDLAPKLETKGIRLELDLDPIQGQVPAKRILTVLENLAANAREAMECGGALRIELKSLPDESSAVLRVADTGCGIRPEDLPHVFEPFFTTKCTVYDPGQHAGLGLAVVHGIMKEMGGSVTLCSTPSGGTVCSVVIPVKLPAGKGS